MSKYNRQMHDATEPPVEGALPPRMDGVEVKGFRAFRHLSIQGLGRVNLITGRNNSGKSSVLEALRILTTNAALDVIADILRYREEDAVGADEEGHSPDPESLFQVSGLFHGFPPLSKHPEPITIHRAAGPALLRCRCASIGFPKNEMRSATTGWFPWHQICSVKQTGLRRWSSGRTTKRELIRSNGFVANFRDLAALDPRSRTAQRHLLARSSVHMPAREPNCGSPCGIGSL